MGFPEGRGRLDPQCVGWLPGALVSLGQHPDRSTKQSFGPWGPASALYAGPGARRPALFCRITKPLFAFRGSRRGSEAFCYVPEPVADVHKLGCHGSFLLSGGHLANGARPIFVPWYGSRDPLRTLRDRVKFLPNQAQFASELGRILLGPYPPSKI